MSKAQKDIVYLRSTLPTEAYFRSRAIMVERIQRHWDDLRMVCRFQGELFWLDLTTYVEAKPWEFSLQIIPRRRSWLWLHHSRIGELTERIDQVLYAERAFSGIRWHRYRELRKEMSRGSDHPSG